MDPIKIKVIFNHGLNAFSLADPEELRCWICETSNLGDIHTVVHVEPGQAGSTFPVYIQFEANLPIEDVGFRVVDSDNKSIPQCREAGNCGGCFLLEGDIEPNSKTTPLIRNDGWTSTSPATQYEFKLWYQQGQAAIGYDPQIYNHGVGEEPWPRRFWRWLRRL